jgi:putative mRNA 3-end processing factor
VEWRDGVHIMKTPIWCDARRTREACFISHAGISEARRHKQVIATDATIALLGGKLRALTSPYGRPFNLGKARLELFPSGAMVGAASLLVDADRRVVYAGTVDPGPGRLPGPAEVRSCDVLVIDATFGHARFRFPPAGEVIARVREWVDARVAAGDTPVLLAEPLGVGMDLVAALGATYRVRVQRGVHEAARKLPALGFPLPPVSRFSGTPGPGEVVIWPPSGRAAPAIARIARRRIALVGAGEAERAGAEIAFPLAGAADFGALVDTIGKTGAKIAYLLGGPGPELYEALAARGIDARPLGPPEQLALHQVL